MKAKVLTFFILTLGLFQIVFGQEVSVTPESERGYLVGPGDVIEGKVLGEDQFNFVATIDEDGKFQVPFFEKGIVATCRTEKELRADVTQLLSKYLKNPQVSVNVTKRNSRPPATIYGEVRQPQQVDLRRKATLLELLSLAGGPTEKAAGTIQVIRTQPPMCSDASEKADWAQVTDNGLNIPSRMYSISSVKSGSDAANPIIYPGDLIVVQSASPIYVIGEVVATGQLPLTEGGMPLTEAIARVGGPNRQAKTKDIKIYRKVPGTTKPQVISANYDLIKKGEQKDIMLEPYDIVEVDKAKKSIAQTVLDIAIGSARGFTNVLPQRVLY
ncbi:MAG: SLBB domain-containing protein [Acidobacteria bacterium]|nr:SLBB domain-containing protein [Acidobacteriota bacterium]